MSPNLDRPARNSGVGGNYGGGDASSSGRNGSSLAEAFRGRGVGKALIEFAEKRIFRETPNVFICVSDFNVDAQAFYARLGYQRVGELKDFIIAGHAEILLRKTIGPIWPASRS